MQDFNEALRNAIQAGNLEECRLLVEYGADVENADCAGETPLMLAAGLGNIDACRFLLDHGSNVNAADKRGMTPFIYGAMNGRIAICRLLADRGANVNAKMDNGWGGLMYAANDGNARFCSVMIKLGCEVNEVCEYGWTPLTRAAHLSRIDACRVLIRNGADLRSLREGLTAFQHAVKKGDKELVRFFLDEAKEDPSQKTLRGRTVMSIAKSEDIKQLLRAAKTQRAIESAMGEGEAIPAARPSKRSLSPL